MIEHVDPRAVDFARAIRSHVLEQSKRANVGHIGSALSIADLVAGLFCGPLRGRSLDDPRRPRFVLSKGHAALAVYAAMYLAGELPRDDLEAFCSDGALTGVHPEHQLAGVDFSTGSLGQGLSFGVGAALAGELGGDQRAVYVLLSDAECNEGSVWEAAMFAGHHQLSSLTAIVDLNGQQAIGYVRDVQEPGSLAERWRTCGWDAVEIDGHDLAAIAPTLHPGRSDRPTVVIAKTTFGKGVSFMEGRIEWHYLPMDDQQYAIAVAEVET